jgi:hypothetical protein
MRPRALVLAFALLGITGCDEDPNCTLLVNVSGGLSGELSWDLSGSEQCGLADASSLTAGARALVIMDRAPDSFVQFIVMVPQGLPAAGTYMGQVLLVTPDDIWQSDADACTVVVASSETEDWSKIDFVQLDGVVDCPGPLVSQSGSEPVTMTTLGFGGHLFVTNLPFENL